MQFNISELTRATSTRYLKRANTIKSSNFSMNLDTLEARSYDWWVFCRRVNGLVIFNITRYSATTDKHQSKAYRALSYKTDLTLRHTLENLTDIEAALIDEVKGTKREISKLIAAIKRPRTRKATNERRREQIVTLLKHINKVRDVQSKINTPTL